MKILMVCLGNICRSPIAEGVMRHKITEAGLNWKVESCGTGGWHSGEPPHKFSQKVSKRNGVDICNQKARSYVKQDMLQYDRIYVMDEDNYLDVKRISEELWNEKKVDYLLNASFPGRNLSVPDPFYGNEAGFQKVYEIINTACECLVQRLVKENDDNKTQEDLSAI